MEENGKIGGLSLEEWSASFRPGMVEFAATHFSFTREDPNLMRIAFGNQGPFVAEGKRAATFTHAVTLSPELAVTLAGMLLKSYGDPEDQVRKTSAEL